MLEIRYDGAEAARPRPALLEAINGAPAILISPSNPLVSVGTILVAAGRPRCTADDRRHDRRGQPDRRRGDDQGAGRPDDARPRDGGLGGRGGAGVRRLPGRAGDRPAGRRAGAARRGRGRRVPSSPTRSCATWTSSARWRAALEQAGLLMNESARVAMPRRRIWAAVPFEGPGRQQAAAGRAARRGRAGALEPGDARRRARRAPPVSSGSSGCCCVTPDAGLAEAGRATTGCAVVADEAREPTSGAAGLESVRCVRRKRSPGRAATDLLDPAGRSAAGRAADVLALLTRPTRRPPS